MPLGARGKLPASVTQVVAGAAGARRTVKVTSKGSTKIELQVTGARKGTPFWLVLGREQQRRLGGDASTAPNIGGSTLVDGYANGWRVQPPSGSFSVTLTWTPQQKVWIAIGDVGGGAARVPVARAAPPQAPVDDDDGRRARRRAAGHRESARRGG